MSKPAITVQASRALKNELGEALINPDTALSNAVLLNDPAGANLFLPVYKSATQATGGSQAFAPSLEADGTLTLYLEAVASPEIAGRVGDARPYIQGTSFWLVLNPNGESTRIPLAAADKGGNNIWRVSTKLAGGTLKAVSDALFDQNPNVAIEIVQSVNMAAPLTERFVADNWPDPGIKKALLDTFGGAFNPGEASSFYMLALQADPQYASQYMALRCTYTTRVGAPPLPGYIQWQVNWCGRAYNYYQDNQERSRIFYLPDKFELAKGPTNAPTISLLQFTMPEGQNSVDKTRATFRVYGKPIVQFERIEEAKRTLQSKIGLVPQMTPLQDAHHVGKTFTQSLPNASGTASNPSVQESASIDLSAGIRNELNLNFEQFRAVWAAIFSTAAENPLFRGWVDIQLLDGKYNDRIDFDGRMPKEQESAYFDDILDTSHEISYSTTLTINTISNTFKSTDPDKQVLALELTFGAGATIVLDKDILKGDVEVQRSIRDIVLGEQALDEYCYRLRVVRSDGTMTCCSRKTDETSLWLMPKTVADCTASCSDATLN